MAEGVSASVQIPINAEAMFWQYALERSPNADWLIGRDDFRAKLMPMLAKWLVSTGIKHADPNWKSLYWRDFHGNSKGKSRRAPGFKDRVFEKEDEIDQLVNEASRWSVALVGADNRELREAAFEVREALIKAKSAVAKAIENVNKMSKLLPDRDTNPNPYPDRLGTKFETVAQYVVRSWCEGGRPFPNGNEDDGGLISLLSSIHFFVTGEEMSEGRAVIGDLRAWRDNLFRAPPF